MMSQIFSGISPQTILILVLNASLIKEITDNERWYLSESRGRDVGPNDDELRDRVCDILVNESPKIRIAVREEFGEYEI